MVQKNYLKDFVIFIAGPTASGKTSLAIEIAKKLNGTVISADSMQVYKELNIGTAKPTAEEMQGIPHKLIDIISIKEQFSASAFVTLARKEIENTLKAGKIPVITGGTGLFIESLIEGYDFNNSAPDPKVRLEIEKFIEKNGLTAAYNLIKEQDSDRASKIHPNNKTRIIRALEILKCGKKNNANNKNSFDYKYVIIGIDFERNLLYERINKRVDIMIENGLLTEIENLLSSGYKDDILKVKAIGYKEFIPFFEGKESVENCILKLKQVTRNYAKRQLTWLRHMKDIIWIDGNNYQLQDVLKEIERKYYEQCGN